MRDLNKFLTIWARASWRLLIISLLQLIYYIVPSISHVLRAESLLYRCLWYISSSEQVIRYFNYCSRALSVLCSWEFFVGSVLWKWGTVLHSNLPISQVEENRYFGWVEDGVHQLVKSIGFWSFGGQNRWHLNALNHKSLKHLIDNWRLPHIRA